MAEAVKSGDLLFDGSDWDFDTLWRTYDVIEGIARDDLGLDLYPNQIEIISSEQMLDAYSSVGMPLMYHHWSFGKQFIFHERQYRKGMRGLAYEIVINSSPCVSYCMEDNTMPLQALVIAHAACGHNHFFKNNHLFQQWTDAEGILDYLDYARDYIQYCEERHGPAEVEQLLDAAHALMSASVFRHRRPPTPSMRAEKERERKRSEEAERAVYYLWSTLDQGDKSKDKTEEAEEYKSKMHLPEENILYFIECYSPALRPWEREILRIVRNIGQYFYPQQQTKIMNEGCACFVHYHILNKLHETGRITDGAMLEILHNHTNVLTQPVFDDPRYGGLNPYAIGFSMMRDIQRICLEPTEEDHRWFPDIAGCRDWRNVLRQAWEGYRDESFVQQFLSPKVIRDFRMFALTDDAKNDWYTVSGIHDESGYQTVRDTFERIGDLSLSQPIIQVVDVDLLGDRVLHLQHRKVAGMPLADSAAKATLQHCKRLWGYEVELTETPVSSSE